MRLRWMAAGLLVWALLMAVGICQGTGLTNGEFDADLDGVLIHYAVYGSGPVVMVLPNSWGLTHDGLRPLFRPLENDFTWVYFDPRGMGGSAPATSDEDLSMATIRRDLEALRKAFVIEEWFPNLFANPERGRETLRAIYKDAKFSWRHFLYSNQVDGKNFDARPDLPRIHCRTLVIAGRHDLAPPEKVEEIHDGIPHSEFVVFENSAHYSPIEEPERFAQVLKDFLRDQ